MRDAALAAISKIESIETDVGILFIDPFPGRD